MTDNNRKGQGADSDFDEEFDFANWSVDGAGDPEPAKGGGSDDDAFPGEDGFSEGAGDPFSEFQMGGAEPSPPAAGAAGFEQQDDDEFFESDEFEGMPMPDAPVTQGDADDEFADVGSTQSQFDDEGDAADFAEDGGQPADGQGEDDEFVDDDVFTGGGAAAAGDEFAEDEADEQAFPEAQPAPAAAGKSPLSKLIFPAAAVVALGTVGYAGYSFVMPLLGVEETPATVATTTAQPPVGTMPSALPGLQGGLDVPGAGTVGPKAIQPPQQQAAPAAQPALGGPQQQQLPPAEGVARATNPFGAGVPSAAPVIPAVPAAPAAPAGAPGAPPALALPTLPPLGGTPSAAALPADTSDDLVGGAERGGIGAMRPAAPAQAPAVPAAVPSAPSGSAQPADVAAIERQIADLRGDIGSIRREIAALTSRLEQIRSAPSVPQEGAAPSRASTLPSDVVPPLKPAIVEGVTLKGVSRDVAWVSTGSGVVEVKEGDTIPGAGQVVRFRAYGGDWVLVTTQGLVTR